MDGAVNPYTPNAAAPPRFLAGRRTEVDDFRTLLRRLGRGYTEQFLVITGLRGVGKAVLLGRYQRIVAEENWVAVDAEVSKNTLFGPQIANLARRALLSVSPKERWTQRVRRAAAVVKSFSLIVQPDGTLMGGLDVDAEAGRADNASHGGTRARGSEGGGGRGGPGRTPEQVAPVRARLISKGLLFTPRYGFAKFTVPRFDRFMRRYMTLEAVPPT